jgi:hypothetical protein
MVGNGCNGNSVGSCGMTGQSTQISMEAYFRHMLMPTWLHDQIIGNCTDWNKPSVTCSALVAEAIAAGGTFNIYSVYDDCSNGDAMPNCTSAAAEAEMLKPAPKSSARYTSLRAPNPSLEQFFKQFHLSPMADHPCQDTDPVSYLNPEVVRQALHVPPQNVTGVWQLCAGINYNQNVASLLPGYPQIISAMRVLIYSGDADFCVPFPGN